jgi:hypothetical protein
VTGSNRRPAACKQGVVNANSFAWCRLHGKLAIFRSQVSRNCHEFFGGILRKMKDDISDIHQLVSQKSEERKRLSRAPAADKRRWRIAAID